MTAKQMTAKQIKGCLIIYGALLITVVTVILTIMAARGDFGG